MLSCEEVSEEHLASIESLDLTSKKLKKLNEKDFDKLFSLQHLFLSMTTNLNLLPEGIFDELSSLANLSLVSNQLSSLLEEIFDNLSSLAILDLSRNQLTSLPKAIFDEIFSLKELNLYGNQFETLSKGIFDGLASLQIL